MTDTTPQEARRLLEAIDSPADLKGLPVEDLPQVCAEVRQFLLDSVPVTGGHLGSNLGVVELTTALHYVFDLRRDRCVWDVSHQAYPHKILTGRRGRFRTLRQTDGLCGFTNPEESSYDLFHTGHAGTSISLGLGLAHGVSRGDDQPQVISVIGDASLGAGVAFEALNNAGASGQRLLVILNDNEWSISKSVGSLARYLSRIRSAKVVQRAGQEFHGLLSAIPLIGEKVDRALDDLGEVMRHAVIPGHVFEELGVTYVGPLNGHDVKYLVENLRRVRELEGVVLLHLLTEKGKGHPKAPTHPERVHGVTAGSGGVVAKSESAKVPRPRTPAGPSGRGGSGEIRKGKAYTQAFSDALLEIAEKDVRVHAVTAGMPSGTGLLAFSEALPGRFHDTGITEQHAVALSAGMAKAGLRPVVAIYSTFLQRAYDQVFQEVCLQDLPVVFCMDRAGFVGQDGPTHNGVFDIAYLRTLPNMALCAPRDETDMRRMLAMALSRSGPTAMRYPRGSAPADETIHPSERREMEPGKAEVLCESDSGDDRNGLVVWAYGPLVDQALVVAARFRQRGVSIGVVDVRFAKPLDEELLSRHLSTHRHLITLEEHQRAGGLGSAVLEVASRLPLPEAARVRVMGVPDRFVTHKTTREEQLAEAGIGVDALERVVHNLLAPQFV